MRADTEGIVCSLRVHGEHGAVVRFLTPERGLQAAYVRGSRGRRMRPVLMAGNRVAVRLSSRSEVQLPQGEVELMRSLGPLLGEPLPAAAIEWVTALVAVALPEGQPYPRLYDALDALIDAVEAAPAASGWASALVRFELLLLAELGFGLDMEPSKNGAVAGAMVAVSSRSGQAVSSVAAEDHSGSLLPLPRFLIEGGQGSWSEIEQGLSLSGHFMHRHLLAEASPGLAAARARLAERLRRAGGSD